MYVIHFDLEGFIAQAERTGLGDETICVNPLLQSHTYGGVDTYATSCLVATYRDLSRTIHAIRLLIEVADVTVQKRDVLRILNARAVVAMEALIVALPGDAFQRRAIHLCPGLYDDLMRFEAEHDLWRWEGDTKGPLTRTLVLTERPNA